MTFTFLYNQPKVPDVQDLSSEVLKMLSAIEALQKRQDVHSTLSSNTKMQFLNLTIIIFCLYCCNVMVIFSLILWIGSIIRAWED